MDDEVRTSKCRNTASNSSPPGALTAFRRDNLQILSLVSSPEASQGAETVHLRWTSVQAVENVYARTTLNLYSDAVRFSGC
jgi:hypothetical protein